MGEAVPATAEIQLNKGFVAIIDAADLPLAGHIHWHVRSMGRTHYAIFSTKMKQKSRHLSLHRLITGAQTGQVVDHINGDGLDNRRANLRICTQKENIRNKRSHLGSGSQYKGVSRHQRSGGWRACITVDGKQLNLGAFPNEVAAALAYDDGARQYFGEFARPNFGPHRDWIFVCDRRRGVSGRAVKPLSVQR